MYTFVDPISNHLLASKRKAEEDIKNQIRANYQQGNECYNKKNYLQAIVHFSKVIEHDSNSKYAYFYRAKCYNYCDMLRFALDDFDNVLKLDPAHSGARTCKTQIEYKLEYSYAHFFKLNNTQLNAYLEKKNLSFETEIARYGDNAL